jgi:hypothetical protein
MVTRCNVWSRGVVGHRVGIRVASSYLARRLLRVTWHEGCFELLGTKVAFIGLARRLLRVTWHEGCFELLGTKVASSYLARRLLS